MIASICVRCLIPLFFFCVSASALPAQSDDPVGTVQNDPLARPRKTQKPGKMESAYKKWQDEVSDIITPEEEAAFNKLTNDAERQTFVETFWRRRDPTPDTEENEYKDEFYRRRVYADEHFSAGVAGSKTDRGRIYIIHGPPDSIESHPVGGPYQRTAEEGGGETNTFPFERWRYRNLDGIGQEVELEFVDTCGCGAYHLSDDPGEKDAFAHVPNAGPTLKESLGLDSKANRGRNGLGTAGSSLFGNNQTKIFDTLRINGAVMAPPAVKYKDLKEVVDIHIRYSLLPFDARVDFLKGGAGTTLVPVTVQVANRNLTFVGKDGVQHASVNIYGRVTTLGGRIVSTFEDPLRLDVPIELMEKSAGNVSLYQQGLPLKPGRYRLDLVLKDVNGDKLGTVYQSILVPDFSEDKLSTSSLVLADLIETVSARDTGAGPFVLGASRVRPRVPPANGDPVTFTRGQQINLWMQVYNLALNKDSGKSEAQIEYKLANLAGGMPALEFAESTSQMTNPGSQITLQKTLPADKLGPGTYELAVTIHDGLSQQELTTKTRFTIK